MQELIIVLWCNLSLQFHMAQATKQYQTTIDKNKTMKLVSSYDNDLRHNLAHWSYLRSYGVGMFTRLK